MGDGFRECGCECGRLESLAMKSVKSLFLFQHGVGEGYSRLDGWNGSCMPGVVDK
jgi:hypothetical protein